jgi:protein archease
MIQSGYEFIDHPADVWVHAWGGNIAKAFEQCAYALMKTMIDSGIIEGKKKREIKMEDNNIGSLLVAFLSEFLFIFDTEELIFNQITVNIEKSTSETKENPSENHFSLHAICLGEEFDDNKHERDTEVKAITYSYLEIDEKEESTHIKIIYDI